MRAKVLPASLVLVLVATCLTAACGARGTSDTKPTSNPNLISAFDIEDARRTGVADLYELIQRIRPRWLQIESERSLRLGTVILVYQNNTRLGTVDVLRGYPLGPMITRIRYLDAAQAGLLPGAGAAGHVHGAIVITTAAGGSGAAMVPDLSLTAVLTR